MGMLSTIITNEREIARICGEIKTSANNKGANIGEFQPLNEWPEQIDTIPAPFVPVWYSYNNKVSGARFNDTLILPTEAIDGTGNKVPLSNDTFQFNTTEGAIAILSSARKLIIPSYYQNANLYGALPNNNTFGRYVCYLEEIEFLGTGNCSLATTNSSTGVGFHMKKFYAPEMTGNCAVRFNSLEPNTNFEITAPKSTRIHELFLQATDTSPITLTGDFSGVTIIRSASNQYNAVGFNYVTGDLSFPACETLGNIAISAYNLTLRFPNLKTMSHAFGNVTSGTGVTNLYIGGDFSTIDTDSANSILVNADRIEIHIPVGESTTKTTLDSAGIPYIQDYVI